MQKFVIPVILAAVVIIAGMFAFVPVQKASTVHGNLASSTSLQAIVERAETISLGATPNNDILAFTCNKSFRLLAVTFPDDTDSADSQLGIQNVFISADGTDATTAEIDDVDALADNDISNIEVIQKLFNGNTDPIVLTGPANGQVRFILDDTDGEAENDSIDIRAYFQTESGASCDITLTAA